MMSKVREFIHQVSLNKVSIQLVNNPEFTVQFPQNLILGWLA